VFTCSPLTVSNNPILLFISSIFRDLQTFALIFLLICTLFATRRESTSYLSSDPKQNVSDPKSSKNPKSDHFDNSDHVDNSEKVDKIDNGEKKDHPSQVLVMALEELGSNQRQDGETASLR